MKILVDKYRIIPTNKDGVQYEILLKKDGEEFWWSIFCSGTLKAIWKADNDDQLFFGLYSLVRQKLITYFRETQEKHLSSLYPLEFTSYNSPRDLPELNYSLPESLEIPQDVTVAVKPLVCRVTVFQPTVEISSIRFDIVDARDFINTFTSQKYNFKLFEIQQERAIVDMYLPCENKETFQSRILALANLISWMNIQGIQSKLKKMPKGNGAIDYLEEFLKQYYPRYNKQIINILRSINRLSWGYPRHPDSEKVIDAYGALGISWPIHDYKLVWEKILNIYSKALNDLLGIIRTN
ncbi:MAG: hypothetical protein ISS45_09970 [Candidatus Omnitrophica bacterium]|nr:hypothetical protein [Candidatus Omnitrophota bacterium]